MHKLTTFFLYAFLADGVVSVLGILGNSPWGHAIAGSVSLAVLLLGALLFVAMVITPRLSKRLLLAPILFLMFSLVWVVIFGENGTLLLSLAEALLGLAMIVGFDDQKGFSPLGVPDFASARPLFTVKNLLLTGSVHGLIGLCLLAGLGLGLCQKARCHVEQSTANFLTIHSGGISLDERIFVKGDREIRLIGMIHVAKKGFYDGIAKALPASSDGVVLLEGVSDRDHLLKSKFGYERMASLFGIASQKDSSFTKKAIDGINQRLSDQAKGIKIEKIEYQPADVDLAEFKPETVRFMGIVGKLIGSPTLREALQTYSESLDDLKRNSGTVWGDILDKRNQHLLGQINLALQSHTLVVVPWGAAHMPEIQRQITKLGFVETRQAQREAVRFENKALIGFISLLDLIAAPRGEER